MHCLDHYGSFGAHMRTWCYLRLPCPISLDRSLYTTARFVLLRWQLPHCAPASSRQWPISRRGLHRTRLDNVTLCWLLGCCTLRSTLPSGGGCLLLLLLPRCNSCSFRLIVLLHRTDKALFRDFEPVFNTESSSTQKYNSLLIVSHFAAKY